ncbi:unnamed protein product [Zymoseptoria tritici ST99CH_3D7]|uniref:Uncharacterized protein n=1 Tax=Zymoseptoria tritici (strain ST99CH_3D7) TaxID=1276538 RepID=A0A1X7RI05_ZYMT9|nr:unnamed protein product [Zymoseptoria tritici ST99CH_3D7]
MRHSTSVGHVRGKFWRNSPKRPDQASAQSTGTAEAIFMSSIIAPRSNIGHHQAEYPQQQHHSQYPTPTQRSASPSAPPYSPITPKVQPALPVTNNTSPAAFVPPENGGNFTFSHPNTPGQQPQPEATSAMNPPTAQYIAPPPTLPFSGEDSTDAIALRAAISTLQFQKKKAQDDLRTLADIKKLALDDPEHFKAELSAGKLKEERPKIGDLRAILDGSNGSDSDDEEEPVTLGAEREDEAGISTQSTELRTEIPDSQPSQPSQLPSKRSSRSSMDIDKAKSFPRIPGPQDIVRTPYVNWEKYGVVGGPLDSIHAQQQRWPGSENFTRDRGREYSIAAPYNPFLDALEAQPRHDGQEIRQDSGSTPVSATGTISEHPMETRSRN